MDSSPLIRESFTVSPNSQWVAYVAGVGNKQFVIVDGKEGKSYDGIGADSLIFSPDSQRVAYVAAVDDKRFVVVDGKEEKQYNAVGALIFSPDSQRVAYAARVRKWFREKCFVIVDGKEGKPYDGIVTRGGGRIIFDSANRLHYLAQKGADIYLVEERIE